MLTEKQVEHMLEKSIDEIKKITDAVPEGQKGNEDQAVIYFQLGMIVAMARVCQCEEALKPMLLAFKVSAAAQSLEKMAK